MPSTLDVNMIPAPKDMSVIVRSQYTGMYDRLALTVSMQPTFSKSSSTPSRLAIKKQTLKHTNE